MAIDLSKATRIWQTILKVPYAKVASYGQIADLAGLPGRARLVGKVIQLAPSELKLPWHRIIKSNGQLAFPRDSKQAQIQKQRLQEEGVVVLNNRINLKRFAWQPCLAEILGMEY